MLIIFDHGPLAATCDHLREVLQQCGVNPDDIEHQVDCVISLGSEMGNVNSHLAYSDYYCDMEMEQYIIEHMDSDQIPATVYDDIYSVIRDIASIFNQHYLSSGCFRIVPVFGIDISVGTYQALDRQRLGDVTYSIAIDDCTPVFDSLDDEMIAAILSCTTDIPVYDHTTGELIRAQDILGSMSRYGGS